MIADRVFDAAEHRFVTPEEAASAKQPYLTIQAIPCSRGVTDVHVSLEWPTRENVQLTRAVEYYTARLAAGFIVNVDVNVVDRLLEAMARAAVVTASFGFYSGEVRCGMHGDHASSALARIWAAILSEKGDTQCAPQR